MNGSFPHRAAGRITRRRFLLASAAIASTRALLAEAGGLQGRLGICTFSCHRQWGALRNPGTAAAVKFSDSLSFYDYVRSLGADGMQNNLTRLDDDAALALRDRVEKTGGYYEGAVSLPKSESDLAGFEEQVRLTRLAGATVFRTFLSGTRRYETWKTRDALREFRAQSVRRLAMAEPIAKAHGIRISVENHKDFTVEELVALMREFSSEWIGVNVDTGNNLALLEDPYATVEALVPFALSVHLKDMAVQPHDSGFQLSEVPIATGFIDIPRIVGMLDRANPAIYFSLEMATRDPLVVPCLTDLYWATFAERDDRKLRRMLDFVEATPPKQPPPAVAGVPLEQQFADEESNNRVSLRWMHEHLG